MNPTFLDSPKAEFWNLFSRQNHRIQLIPFGLSQVTQKKIYSTNTGHFGELLKPVNKYVFEFSQNGLS